jgi:acetyltransferase-like isoleucine patch superfamily enzyme
MLVRSPIMTKTVLKDHQIGDFTYGTPKVIGKGDLTIGKFCSIADGVTILLNIEHRSDWATTYPFSVLFPGAQHIAGHPRGKGPVVIGNDVWIGYRATILSGVTIGNGAIIGANAVVAKDVAPYSVVAGSPAQHLKYRFAEEWCDSLNRRIRWWEWEIDVILARIDDLLQPPGDHLIKYFRKKGE